MPSMSEIVSGRTDLPRTTTSGCACWSPSGTCSRTSASPTWSCGSRTDDPNVYWAAAQIRPTTGPTSLFDDVVGDLIAYSPEHLVSGAFVSREMTRTSEANCTPESRSTSRHPGQLGRTG